MAEDRERDNELFHSLKPHHLATNPKEAWTPCQGPIRIKELGDEGRCSKERELHEHNLQRRGLYSSATQLKRGSNMPSSLFFLQTYRGRVARHGSEAGLQFLANRNPSSP